MRAIMPPKAGWITNLEYTPARFLHLWRTAPPDLPYGPRVERLCEELAGRPYRADPLGGGPDRTEALTVSLTAFDCVTFIEEVTAFCRAGSEAEFLKLLRLLRYEDGRVEYLRRRHYLADWLAGNAAGGRLRLLDPPSVPPPRRWERTLEVLPALGRRPAEIRGWPKQSWPRLRPAVRTGDLIGFVSTRRNLDYFHTGVLIVRSSHVLLAHASRSRDGVVLIPLAEFLRAERMSGLTVVRPWPETVEPEILPEVAMP
jgi:hypothetical protein